MYILIVLISIYCIVLVCIVYIVLISIMYVLSVLKKVLYQIYNFNFPF